jgi:hypothetical protein
VADRKTLEAHTLYTFVTSKLLLRVVGFSAFVMSPARRGETKTMEGDGGEEPEYPAFKHRRVFGLGSSKH